MIFYVPPPSTQFFLEIAVVQSAALQECCGSEITCRVETSSITNFTETPRREQIYIIYHAGCETLSFPWKGTVPYIVANFEQSVAGHFHTPHFIDRVKRARVVWEYSKSNIECWRVRYGIEAKFVPFGYHRQLESIVHAPQRPLTTPGYRIDILFYGASHPRRSALLAKLRVLGLTVLEVHSIFGNALWSLVRQATILVNIHYYQPSILEVCRIIPAIVAGKLMISERSDDPLLDQMYSTITILTKDDQDFIQKCLFYIANPSEREQRARQHYDTLVNSFQQTEVFHGSWREMLLFC